jgi:hypothetical protein
MDYSNYRPLAPSAPAEYELNPIATPVVGRQPLHHGQQGAIKFVEPFEVYHGDHEQDIIEGIVVESGSSSIRGFSRLDQDLTIISATRDGERLVATEENAVQIAKLVAAASSHGITRALEASNNDPIELDPSPFVASHDAASDLRPHPISVGPVTPSFPPRQEYVISEYKSIYDQPPAIANASSASGYQCQEYKSIYDS